MKAKKLAKRLLAGLCAASMLLTSAGMTGYAQAQEAKCELTTAAAGINEKMKLWYTKPANINTANSSGASWMQEALPLGNGTLGNLIFGGISKERVHFNEKTLWTGGPSPSRPDYAFGNKATAYTAEEIEEYRQILDDKSINVFNDTHGVGYAPIRFPGATEYKGTYQDFGDIWLDYAPTGISDAAVSNYRRELDIQTGIASTSFTYKNVEYMREHFVSEPDNVMVTNLTASEPGKLSVDISMSLNNNELTNEPSMNPAENTCSIQGKVKDNDLKFRTTMKVVPEGGTITADEANGVYHVENADSIKIVMAAETDYINDFPTYRDADKDLVEVVDQRAITMAAKDYEAMKADHVADHQKLFDRVELDLGEDLSAIPTNQLVDQYRAGDYSQYLEVLSYQYGRYLSIAGSRGILPSNLCGLWTVGPGAWSGDYHFNVNVQMNYWPVYVNNLAECGKTFVDYMDGLREPGRITAERVHGIENATTEHTGFVVHTGSNPFGMTAPSNAQEYGWNPGGIAWAIQNVWQDYEFTEDSTYLKEKLYPIMKEAALFWDNYLWESKYQKIDDETSSYNGGNRLVVSPSVSAEQGPTVNGSTYDQSLVWELYKECITAGKIVGEDEAVLADWADKMERLDPININQTGGIKEWYEETRVGTETGHHQSYAQAGNLAEVRVPNSGWYVGHPGEQRHASHLVGLYPGTLINKDNPEYMAAAVQSLNERGFYSTGWSKANKINLWARTGNGNNAYKVMKNLIGGKSSGLQYNLFDSHGTGGGDTMMNGSPIWQIDGNYGLTAGVAEMLVQSQLGYTQFLPAIPDEWVKGHVEGLKARGNFTIGETWTMGLPVEFTVCYEGENDSSVFTAEYDNIANAKVYADGEEVTFTTDEETGHISFEAVNGTTYTIDMRGTIADALKEKAEAFLSELDADLTAVKEELQSAVDSDSKELGTVLEKAQLMNELYAQYQKNAENVYYLTAEADVSWDDIDAIYLEMRELKEKLLKNTGDLVYYEAAGRKLQQTAGIINTQVTDNVISFSKESGSVSADDNMLTLSKQDGAERFDIRYTLDGSVPRKDSALYESAIALSADKNTTVRAALFLKDQRVSPVYTENYAGKISIAGVTANTGNWGSQYYPEKMIDGNYDTRYASKDPYNGDIEIVLTLERAAAVNTLKWDQFISGHNYIRDFEIQALQGEEYKTVYSGKATNAGTGGDHSVEVFTFDTVTTDSVKLVLKEGYSDTSIYEVEVLGLVKAEEPAANADDLKVMIALAEAADRNSQEYANAKQSLKDAFEESITDAKEAEKLTQLQMDSREAFLRNRYNRIGFGETDKSDLEALIAEAEGKLEEDYTRDSLYRLKKALNDAKAVLEDEAAKQPAVDRAAAALQTAIDNLTRNQGTAKVIPPAQLNGGENWWTAGNGFRYTYGDGAGQLTYSFEGNGIQVLTVKGSDHGIMRVIIKNADGEEIYNEELDTYQANREEGAVLLKENFAEGSYTIAFEWVGRSPNAPSAKGYVEVGELTIWKSAAEVVERESLEKEIAVCESLDQDTYTEESWAALQAVLADAKAVLAKADEDTCTAEMENWAELLAAARKALVEDGEKENSFEDVKADRYDYEAILWATKENIAQGIDDTHFAPDMRASRADVVTFLWRANGCPKAEITETLFEDVEVGTYYYEALLWAAEEEITAGIDTTHFAPDRTVTRAEFVTLLHRAEGTPDSEIENPFCDVQEELYYYDAVLWAAERGITVGTEENFFRPNGSCTRGQVVTFLYRAQ